MPSRCRQARAQRVDLVVQALLSDTAFGDQAAAAADSGQQRFVIISGNRPSLTLPGQIRQRSTVPVVGLEPA